MAEKLIELLALSEPVFKKILPIKPVHKKPPFPEVPSSIWWDGRDGRYNGLWIVDWGSI